MNRVNIAGYDICVDHVRELESLQALKDDLRFFHQHAGKERNDLCKQLWDQVKKLSEGKAEK